MVFKAPPPDILKMWTKRYPNLPLSLGPKFCNFPLRSYSFAVRKLEVMFLFGSDFILKF